MKCDKGRCKILYHRRNNPVPQYSLGAKQLEGSVLAKDLRILVDAKMNMSHYVPLQQRKLTASWAELERALPASQWR